MSNKFKNKLLEIQRNRRAHRVWCSVLLVLLSITAFFTTYALILPAITMETETICGRESHRHGEGCYDAEGNLICTLEEHEHDTPCFSQPTSIEQEYICGYFYEHEHTDECYTTDGRIACTLMEHNHTEECLSVPDPVESTGTDTENEPVEERIIPFGLMAASSPLTAPAGDVYSCDLSEFLTDVKLTDIDGNIIDLSDREAVINVGERYKLKLHFDEEPDTNYFKQFEYNSDGYLIYDLDATGLKFDSSHSVDGNITIMHNGIQKVVGHYIFELDSAAGHHLAKVVFYEVDDRGEPTPGRNFIDHVQDAGFGLEVSVIVDADGSNDDLNLNLGASWNVTLKKNDDVCLTVDKVDDGNDIPYEDRYPKYDEATHSMLYKVVVKCTQGAVDNIRYSDSGTIKVLDVEYDLTDPGYSNYYGFVITDLDGNTVATGDSFDCLSAASGPISNGEGYVIYYKMKIDPPGREDILDQAAALNTTVNNTIAVDYENPNDSTAPCPTRESSTSTRISVTNLRKDGVANGGTDSEGNKIIYWTVIAGDKCDTLTAPFTVKDTISAGHSFYPTISPTWELIDSNDNPMESGTFTSADFTVSDDTLTFSLPHDTEYRFKVCYTTVTDNDDGGTYSNTVEILEKDWTVTKSLHVAGGIGSMTKEVTGSDSDYVYFNVTANIPHSASPFRFSFSDRLYFSTKSNKIENLPEDFSVQVEYYDEHGDKVTVDIPRYNTAEENSYASGEVRYHIKQSAGSSINDRYVWDILFFSGKENINNGNLSTWYFNDYDSVLTVSYKIPKSAVAYVGSETTTVREILSSGRRISNEVYFSNNYQATVSYTEPVPVTKRGRIMDFTDGTFYYEVAFTNDVIPLGETNPKNYLPLCENFADAIFSDTFDEALEYEPGSLTAFVYRRSDNTPFCYIGSHYGIDGNNKGNSPKIMGIFRYQGANPTGNTIHAAWDDFVYEKQTGPDSFYIGDRIYRDWSIDEYFRLDTSGEHDSTTLEQFANILKNSSGENDTAVVFVYQLRIKDEHKLDERIDVQNAALVSWSQPDIGTYVSPPAVFNIDYDPSLVKKEMNYESGDVVSYEIVINPHGMDLTSEATMTVRDEMCSALSPYMASLKVYAGTPDLPEPVWGGEIDPTALYDAGANVITMTLPDDVPLKITYNCLILGVEEGQSVALDNSVSINGTPNSVNVNHANVMITASSSTGIGKNHYMFLQKQDNDNYPLNGAEFALYGNKETNQGIAPEGVAQEITYKGVTLYYYSSHTTQDDSENAYLHGVFRLDETHDQLESKGLFALVEVKAPSGFDVNPDPLLFYWLDTPDDAMEGVEVFKHEKDYAFVDQLLSYTLPETGSSIGLLHMCIAVFCFTAVIALAFLKITRALRQKNGYKQ